ncbi:MAG: flagellar basal body P-ring formation chaperone FlgA [Parvularcula sp.]
MAIGLLIALFAGPVYADERLPAGTVLEEAYLSGEPQDVQALVGRETIRTIYPGKPILRTQTKEADLIERNDLVRIIAKRGALRIETQGRALGAGTIGTEIRVMNLESKRTIVATIAGDGIVEVSL